MHKCKGWTEFYGISSSLLKCFKLAGCLLKPVFGRSSDSLGDLNGHLTVVNNFLGAVNLSVLG